VGFGLGIEFWEVLIVGRQSKAGSPVTGRAGSVPAGGGSSLLDTQQTALFLNTTPRFVRRLVHERRIPHLKIGRFVRFDPDELRSWLDECRQEPIL
jgi:excisionase family DNA binding protein